MEAGLKLEPLLFPQIVKRLGKESERPLVKKEVWSFLLQRKEKKMLIRKLLALSAALGTVLVLGLTARAQEVNTPSAAAKSITRIFDPVIMEGRLFPELMGKKIEKLRLFAFLDAEFKPIPFQIDEKLPDGSYVLPNLVPGVRAGKDVTTNDEDQGLFDENDDLIFLVKDIGDRAVRSLWREGYDKGMEIVITDPLTGGKGYAYLLHFDLPPPPSEVDYVKLHIGEKRITVEASRYTMGGPVNATYFDYGSRIGADGKKGPDILDRAEKVRAKAKMRFLRIGFIYATDVVTKSYPLAWKDGPVRVITRAKHATDLKIIKFKMSGYAESYFYFNYLIRPTILELPISMGKFLSSFDLYGAIDFTEAIYGAKVYDAVNTRGTVLDGKMSEAEKALITDVDHGWVLGIHPTMGAMLTRLFFPPEWLKHVKRGSYIVDDETINEEPEDNPGQIKVGYYLGNFVKCLTKGRHVYYEHFYFPEKLKWGEQDKILNIVDNPVKTGTGPGIE